MRPVIASTRCLPRMTLTRRATSQPGQSTWRNGVGVIAPGRGLVGSDEINEHMLVRQGQAKFSQGYVAPDGADDRRVG